MPLWVLWRKGDAVTESVRKYRWLDAKQFRRRIFYFKKAAIGIERPANDLVGQKAAIGEQCIEQSKQWYRQYICYDPC